MSTIQLDLDNNPADMAKANVLLQLSCQTTGVTAKDLKRLEGKIDILLERTKSTSETLKNQQQTIQTNTQPASPVNSDEIARMQAEIDRLTADNAQLKTDNERLTADNAHLKQENETLQSKSKGFTCGEFTCLLYAAARMIEKTEPIKSKLKKLFSQITGYSESRFDKKLMGTFSQEDKQRVAELTRPYLPNWADLILKL